MAGMIVATYESGPPETLWHYPRVAGFPEIIKSRTLWASDTLTMTDTTEFTYPRAVFLRVMDRMDAASSDANERWVIAMAKIVAGDDMGATIYAACTSAAADLRRQWDTFADDGKGFAIGLNRRALYDAAASQGYSLISVYYAVAEQESFYEREFRRDAVDTVLKVIERFGKEDPRTRIAIALAFSYMLTFVKNCDYEAEREWRLVHLDNHLDPDRAPAKIRGDNIRYEEVALDNPVTGECAISEVMAGPKVTDWEVEQARRLLNDNGLGDVPITRSALR